MSKVILEQLSHWALQMEDRVRDLVDFDDKYEDLQTNIQTLVADIQTEIDEYEPPEPDLGIYGMFSLGGVDESEL